MIRDFNDWEEYKGASEGSGRSEKVWLSSNNGLDIVLFKFNKTDQTTENVSELIAADIAICLGIENARIEIGTYQGRIGCASYRINKECESLIEGVRLINKYYPDYDERTLFDEGSQTYYSLEMILRSLEEYNFKNDFFKVILLDFIIGNSDRHQSNWAILSDGEINRLCPIYDNGSSLCSYISEEEVDLYLGKDKVRFRALIDSKSRSIIRIDSKVKKQPTHLEMLQYIYNNYHNETYELINKAILVLTNEKIDGILNQYPDDVITKKKKCLISRFVKGKMKLLESIVEGGIIC